MSTETTFVCDWCVSKITNGELVRATWQTFEGEDLCGACVKARRASLDFARAGRIEQKRIGQG